MTVALLVLLVLLFVLPFVWKPVERNLEIFLFAVGLVGSFVARVMGLDLLRQIFENRLMYYITAAVLAAGLIFKFLRAPLKGAVERAVGRMPLRLFVFLVIFALSVASSAITVIVAALILVEIVNTLPVPRGKKVQITVVACFAMGIGSALTPMGGPLSAIVASRLGVGFFYFLQQFTWFILPGVAALAGLGALLAPARPLAAETTAELMEERSVDTEIESDESYRSILVRAGKMFLFIVALEMLGEDFKPIIGANVVGLDSRLLYWGNMSSCVLDNATLAAAEFGPRMTQEQIRAAFMALLISGGMLIPGNIPNIVSAGILKIKSREWAKLGVPLGVGLLAVYFILLFFIL